MISPGEIASRFEQFEARAGILGAALGPKETNGSAAGNPLSLTFFVRKKLPAHGAAKRLADGRIRLPKTIEFQGTRVPTDVVELGGASSTGSIGVRSPPKTFRAGGKVSNLQLTGTIGCLVSRNDQRGLYALTNSHIGLSLGTKMFFPDHHTIGAIIGTTQGSVSLVEDERFLPAFDEPDSYIDVDAALVRIPQQFEDRFSPDIPHYGRPAGMFVPDASSQSAYLASLIGKQVFSYSWKSKQREGVISHVYYVLRRLPNGTLSIANFLVQGSNHTVPGIVGDSGKLWMVRSAGANLAIGIHFGIVAQSPTSPRFAMVTEFSSLAHFLNMKLI